MPFQAQVVLKPGRERALHKRHPWVYSGAVERVKGAPSPGQSVRVLAQDGRPLGVGAFSPKSQIMVRIWSFDSEEPIDEAFFARRLTRALEARSRLGPPPSTAYRVVHGESDGLPGLIVDRYGAFLVCQFLSLGVERHKEEIVGSLRTLGSWAGIYERSEGEMRGKEGLPPRSGPLWGEAPPERVMIQEGLLRFGVDLRRGHKTGFYLDQRENRARIASWSEGAEVLNVFAYSGGFGIWAQASGARQVVHVESSSDALVLARENVYINGLDEAKATWVVGNAFEVLRQMKDAEKRYDLIVLDPPKFAANLSQVPSAARGYKDINLQAFRLLRPGGILFTFSCSMAVDPDLFWKIVAGAALDAGREVQLLQRLGQSSDHPTSLFFPQGEYLKGLICRAH